MYAYSLNHTSLINLVLAESLQLSLNQSSIQILANICFAFLISPKRLIVSLNSFVFSFSQFLKNF